MTCTGHAAHNVRISNEMTVKNALQHSLDTWVSLYSPTVMDSRIVGHNLFQSLTLTTLLRVNITIKMSPSMPLRHIREAEIQLNYSYPRRGKQMSGQIYCPVASLPRDEISVPSDWETVDSWCFGVQALALCRIRTQDRPASNVVDIPTTLSPVAQFVCVIALPSAADVTRCTGGWRLSVS